MTDTKREELPKCAYGVYVKTEEGVEACEEPAVARWTWDGGKTWLVVCSEHDCIIAASEDVDLKW